MLGAAEGPLENQTHRLRDAEEMEMENGQSAHDADINKQILIFKPDSLALVPKQASMASKLLSCQNGCHICPEANRSRDDGLTVLTGKVPTTSMYNTVDTG